MAIVNDKVASAIFILLAPLLAPKNLHAQIVPKIIPDVISIEASLVDDSTKNKVFSSNFSKQNIALVAQETSSLSPNNSLDLAQSGDLNLLDLLIDGENNELSIFQHGTENQSYGILRANFTNLIVEQTGTHNVVAFQSSGLGDSLYISQTGRYNVANVVQKN